MEGGQRLRAMMRVDVRHKRRKTGAGTWCDGQRPTWLSITGTSASVAYGRGGRLKFCCAREQQGGALPLPSCGGHWQAPGYLSIRRRNAPRQHQTAAPGCTAARACRRGATPAPASWGQHALAAKRMSPPPMGLADDQHAPIARNSSQRVRRAFDGYGSSSVDLHFISSLSPQNNAAMKDTFTLGCMD